MQYRKPILAVMLTTVLCCAGCRSTKETSRVEDNTVEVHGSGTTLQEVSGESEEETTWSDTTQTVSPEGDTTTTINSGRRTTQRKAKASASEQRTETTKEETHKQEETTEAKAPVAKTERQAGEPRWKCWVRDFASGFVTCLLITTGIKIYRRIKKATEK